MPCRHHPGWQDNYAAPCPLAPFACDSRLCAPAPYVPKAVRKRLNFTGHHARAFSLSAFASWAEPPASLADQMRQILQGYKTSVPSEQWAAFYATLPNDLRQRLTERYQL